MIRTLLLISICWLSSKCLAQVSSITVTGSWNPSAAGLITEAGLNYSSYLTSSPNQSLVSLVSVTSNWEVKVEQQNNNWTSDLQLWIRRTGDGTALGGIGTISGTPTYTLLTSMPTTLFSGTGPDRNDIPIEYQVRGLSVLTPVASYSATIVFTLMDL